MTFEEIIANLGEPSSAWVELTFEEMPDFERREMLLETGIECIKQYVLLSPSPHAGATIILDAQLSFLTKEWAFSRDQLLDHLREPI